MTDKEELTPGEAKFYGVLWAIISVAALAFAGWQAHSMATTIFYLTVGDWVLLVCCVVVALFFAWCAWVFFRKD